MNSTTRWFSMNTILMLIFLVVILPPSTSIVIGSIKPNQPMRDGDVLLSNTEIFALGFFSPANSRNRYVGVWYNRVPKQTIVWVANRDNPIIPVTVNNNASGVGLVAVHGNGGLVIYGKDQNTPLWSANVSVSSPNKSMTAKLLDTGNLVLLEKDDGVSQRVLWQGFDHPTNTMLPFMKLGLDRFLTSWKSQDDPGTGNYSYQINPSGFPQSFIYKGQAPIWRSGPWTGERWSGVPEMTNNIFNVSFVNNQDELSLVYGIINESNFSMIVLCESGTLVLSKWQDQAQQWIKFWYAPEEQCDEYGKCGANSNCDPSNAGKFECTCLPGYEPKSPRAWYLRDGSGGCVRKNGVSMCGNGDEFVKVARVKVPDSSEARVNMSLSWKECKQECLRNCSCKAYANADERWGGFGCVTWHGDLMDTITFSNAGQDFYVRVDAIVLDQYAKANCSLSKKGKLAISLVSIMVFLLLVVPLSYWLVRRKREGKQRRQNKYSSRVTTRSSYFEDSTADVDESRVHSDLPFFDLTAMAAATDNFSLANMLGNGGFGSVYKGVLCNGKEVAVKRLSKHSGQGIEEFKNEIMLIAKLQHRNLVRILGYCVQDEEKMLIYEYVPNKSLDSFIFNDTKRALLDWTGRFRIIYGVARGILYLHQDSRLRIIHRDLKASNVLLDASMNPKISDFGMARIFRGDQSEANTNRVVGTYGYMSPEYVMKGHFSMKSDVYSFGVILLEIVTGRKNSVYYHDKYPSLNLVGLVWNLWREGKVLEMVDPSLCELYPVNEVVRCIQIALLCVQEHATDRPTMSAVVFMLGNCDAAVPSPRQPAFLLHRDPPTSTEGANSMNDVTCTSVEAR